LRYGQVARHRYNIVRIGTTNYVRLSNLEFDTYYDISVYKATTASRFTQPNL